MCIGVIYFVVFGGFFLLVIVDWINDLGVKVVIILDEGCCVGNCVLFKVNVDEVVL